MRPSGWTEWWLGPRRWLFVMLLGLCVGMALPFVALGQTPESDDGAGAAAIVIDTGSDEPTYVVATLDDTGMTAIDLLREADIPLVTVSFGGLGEGVCTIVRTGCDVAECQRRLCQTGDPESPFWQFWIQDDAEEWAMSALGGSQHQVDDGEIVAWSWTGVELELPALSWSDVASLAGAPEEIVAGTASDVPGVWVSDVTLEDDDKTPSVAGMLASTGVIVLLAGIGLFLIRRQRTHAVETT